MADQKKMTEQIISEMIDEHVTVMSDVKKLLPQINEIINLSVTALQRGNKILVCGNGGSAADSQHLAAELVGRYKKERAGLPVIALTTDTSILTSVGNDYSMDELFARQVEALGGRGDVLIGISTSGNSINVLKAVEKGNEKGCVTVGLLGKTGGRIKAGVRHGIVIPSENTPRVQEAHGLIVHMFCECVENRMFPG